MATNSILPHTVTLYNYIGEENYEASYIKTILKNVLIVESSGAQKGIDGDTPDVSASLYVFDRNVIATDIDGTIKTYVPFEEWEVCHDKSLFWTVRTDGTDFFIKGICDEEEPAGIENIHQSLKASYFDLGSAKMRHWEINGC